MDAKTLFVVDSSVVGRMSVPQAVGLAIAQTVDLMGAGTRFCLPEAMVCRQIPPLDQHFGGLLTQSPVCRNLIPTISAVT